MLTLDTLNVMMTVSEEAMIEELIVALLASPQLALFLEKFPPTGNRPLLTMFPAGAKR